MAKRRNGNGQAGTIADLVAGMVEEMGEVQRELAEVGERVQRAEHHMARLARMMSKVGDVLADHERRLAALEGR